MPPASTATRRRKELIPVIARAFAEYGYRRTTTAELARRCGVQETILYRLWPDKRATFLAAIEYVYQLSEQTWQQLREQGDSRHSVAERILRYEARHQGEFGLYRILFAGLGESDDPEIRRTLRKLYTRFHRFIEKEMQAHRHSNGHGPEPGAALAAWAVVGLGTVANIGRELGLISAPRRKQLFDQVGRFLLEGSAT